MTLVLSAARAAGIGGVVALLSAAPMASPADAQGRDRCHDYANEMIGIDQRGRQARCQGWTGHSNYQNHYNWCTARRPGDEQAALGRWGTRLQTCQFAASGSPAAQQQMARPVRYSFQWVQLGGRWKSGVHSSVDGKCGHGAPGANCGPGQNWSGSYANGAVTQWRMGGCQRPIISIQCIVKRAP